MRGWAVNASQEVLHRFFEQGQPESSDSFPVVKGRGANSQLSIESEPNEWWIPKSGTRPRTDNLLQKAGHLLITNGQRNATARLTATAGAKYVASGWVPVTGLSETEAKAVAVFLNSTAGRIQLMRNAGRTVEFPQYNPAGISNIRIPDIKDTHIQNTLAACWERTRDMLVPQFRDGDCEVRRLWDEAVADAMGWDADELANLRALLCREPHVRGKGYNEYDDAD